MIYIAGDHYATELIQKVEQYLRSGNLTCENIGSKSSEQKLSLEAMIPALTSRVLATPDSVGILVCGTGAGVEIGANRFAGIRASLCIDPKQAEYARVYDNANVLCMSSWLTTNPGEILDAWFSSSFDNDEARKKMIKQFDDWH